VSSKTLRRGNNVIMEEDESVQVEMKAESGCEFVVEVG
jgi:hypothetical protein